MRRTGAEKLHPANKIAIALASQYSDPDDPEGSVRFLADDKTDSLWDNCMMLPAKPIAGAHVKQWVFYDANDVDKTNVWKIRAQDTEPGGTTLGLVSGKGGGGVFSTSDLDEDAIRMVESQNEIANFEDGKEMWVEFRFKVDVGVDQVSGERKSAAIFLGLMEPPAGGDLPDFISLRDIPNRSGLYFKFEVGPDAIHESVNYTSLDCADYDPANRVLTSGGLGASGSLSDGEYHTIGFHLTKGEVPALKIFVDNHLKAKQYWVLTDADMAVVWGVKSDSAISAVDNIGVTVTVQRVTIMQDE